MSKTNLKLLSVFNFLIGFNFFWPIAIIYFSKISGSFTLGASILGLITLSSTIFEIPTGILSDRVGRKYTMVLGTWTRAFAFLFYAIGSSYWILVMGAIFEGVSRAFYSGNNDAFLYDTLADDNKTEEYHEFQGKVYSTEQLAMGISAILGGIIAHWSFSLVMWLSLIPQIAMLFVSYQFLDPKPRSKLSTNIYTHIKESFNLFVINKKLRYLSLASILGYSIGELKWEFSSAFIATVWPTWAIGIAKTLSGFGASLSFFLSGRIIRRFKEINVLLFNEIYGKTIDLISLAFPTVFSPFLMSTRSLLFGVASVAEKTLMQKEFTDHQRATMGSINSFGGSLGFAGMSLILGGMADLLGPAKAMLILTIISLPVIYLYWLINKSDGKIQKDLSTLTPKGRA